MFIFLSSQIAATMMQIIKLRGTVFTKLGSSGSSTIAIPARCIRACKTQMVLYGTGDQKYSGSHSTCVPLDCVPDDDSTQPGPESPLVVWQPTPPEAGWWPTVELLFDPDMLLAELGQWAAVLLETMLLICVWQGTESPLWAWPMYQPSRLPPLQNDPDPDLADWNVVMPANGLDQGVWEEVPDTGGASSSSAPAPDGDPAFQNLMATLRGLSLDQRERLLQAAKSQPKK